MNVLDEMLWSDDIAYSPPSSIECLTNRADREGIVCKGRTQRGNTREADTEMLALVYFVGENENAMRDAKITDGIQLLPGENLPKRVMSAPGLAEEPRRAEVQDDYTGN